eukprot:g8854.t1
MGRHQHDCGCCPSGEAARAPADEKTKSRRECCCAAFWERCFDDLQVPNDDPDELWFNEPRDWLAHYPVFVSVSRLISLLSFGFGVVSNFFLKEELHRTFFPYLTRLNVLLGLLFYVLIYYREKRLYAHAVFASIYSLQKSGVKSRVDATIEQEEQEKDGGRVYSSERRMASSILSHSKSTLTRVCRVLQEWLIIVSIFVTLFYWLLIYQPPSFAAVTNNSRIWQARISDPSRNHNVNRFTQMRTSFQDLRYLELQDELVIAARKAAAGGGGAGGGAAAGAGGEDEHQISQILKELEANSLQHHPLAQFQNQDDRENERHKIVDTVRADEDRRAQETLDAYRAQKDENLQERLQQQHPLSYKLFLYSSAQKELEFGSSVAEHAMISFAALTELFLFKQRFNYGRLFWIMMVLLLYLALNIAWSFGFNLPVYPMLDWKHKPGIAVAYALGSLSCIALFYTGLYFAFRSQCANGSKYYPHGGRGPRGEKQGRGEVEGAEGAADDLDLQEQGRDEEGGMQFADEVRLLSRSSRRGGSKDEEQGMQ